jgi:hypothetical protein
LVLLFRYSVHDSWELRPSSIFLLSSRNAG